MNKQKTKLSHDLAKKMIIEGESFDTIMETTHLRLKDLKRIQKKWNRYSLLVININIFV